MALKIRRENRQTQTGGNTAKIKNKKQFAIARENGRENRQIENLYMCFTPKTKMMHVKRLNILWLHKLIWHVAGRALKGREN